MEVGGELGEEPEGGERAGVVQHLAAAARRPDERQHVAGEALVQRPLEGDLARMGAGDREQLWPVLGRPAERGVVVDDRLPAQAMGQKAQAVDRARAHRIG